MFRLVLVVVLLFDTQSQVGCLDEEGLALFSFKRSVLEDPEGALGNWNQSDANPCSWNGITCKDQRVVSLSIPKKKLSGLLPSALGSLSGLRHVNLRSNRFNGALPIQLFRLQGLQSLVLRGNSLSGPLPSVVGKLDYLQTLDLSENLLNGSLPSSILRCKRLRVLDLGANNFTGPLPDGFGANLVSLQTLDLSYNQFNASIPTDLGNLSSLQGTVDLSHNLFSGLIPAGLGDLPEKVYIDLTYNSLSGAIPQNGALINRGPTAFIGNPGLCGAPLKTPCSSDSGPAPYPHLPSSSSSNQNQGRGLSRKAVVAMIIASDIVGICLVGLLFSYCYTRICQCGEGETLTKAEEKGGRKDCLCFTKDGCETPGENVEQHDLIALDAQVGFDLDQLLKASAFVLGKSGIGIVYKVVLEDGVSLAVRRLGEGGSQRFKEFQTEVEAVGKLRHPNMVTLRAYYWSVDEKLLIYEYISGGSLDTALHGKPGLQSFTPLPWSTRLSIVRGVAKGLVYLHDFSPKKYVHGQLKPSNVLLGESMEAKMSDFGLGRLANIAGGSPTAQSSRRMTSEQVYQAPESVKAVKPSQKWDVYSYGVLLIETVTGRSPLVQEMDLVQWLQHCIDQQAPLAHVLDPCLPQDADKEDEIVALLKLAMACVHASPEKRPTMRHVSEALDRVSNKPTD